MSAAATPIGEYLDAMGAATPAPAGGSGAALAGAIAAALAELAAGVSGETARAAEAHALRARLVALADEDAEAYAAFLATRSEEDRRRTLDVPLAIASSAGRVGELARDLAAHGKASVRGDAEAAGELARAAQAIGTRLAAINEAAT